MLNLQAKATYLQGRDNLPGGFDSFDILYIYIYIISCKSGSHLESGQTLTVMQHHIDLEQRTVFDACLPQDLRRDEHDQ